MALLTVSDYIYAALRRCGQLRPGATSGTDLMNDALDSWKLIYDSMNAKRTNAFSIPDYVYPVSTSTSLDGIYGENVQFSIGPTFTVDLTLQTSVTALCTNTAGLNIGQSITGSGIPALTTIQGISIDTSITLSAAATTSGPITGTVVASFTGPRPESIIRMNLLLTSANPTQPTRIPLSPMSAEEWARIPVVQFNAINVATSFYYDPQFPQGVINVFPPLNGNSLEIFTWGFLTPPTSLTQAYSAPPGYAEVVIWNLARELWPLATNSVFVNKLPFQFICGQAAKARAAVQAVNAPSPRMRNDFGGSLKSTRAVCDWGLLLTGSPY